MSRRISHELKLSRSKKKKQNKTKLTYLKLKRLLVFPGQLKWHFVEFYNRWYYKLKEDFFFSA